MVREPEQEEKLILHLQVRLLDARKLDLGQVKIEEKFDGPLGK